MIVLRIVLRLVTGSIVFLPLMAAHGIAFLPKLERVNAVGGDPAMLNKEYAIAQDDRGQVCVSARTLGLFCYDGSSLHRLHANSRGLVSVFVKGEKHLHFADNNALYALFNGRVEPVKLSEPLPFSKKESIKWLVDASFAQLPLNAYFVISTEAVYKFSNGTLKKVFALLDDKLVFFVRQVFDKNLYELGTQNGLLTVNEYGEIVKHEYKGLKVMFRMDALTLTHGGLYRNGQNLMAASFRSAVKDSKGRILLTSSKGLCTYDKTLNCPQRAEEVFKSVYLDHKDNLWAISNNGLKYARNTQFQYIDARYGLTDNRVFALAKKDKNVFIGTMKGVNRLDTSTDHISLLDGTADLFVRSLLVDADRLWIASINKGLYLYNLPEQRLQSVDGMIKERVVSMVKFNQHIWLATLYSGLSIYTTDGTLVEKNIHPGIRQIKKMAVCDDKLLIASLWNGLVQMDSNKTLLSQTDQLTPHTFDCNKANIMAAGREDIAELDSRLMTRRKTESDGTITTLFYYNDNLWRLEEDGLVMHDDESLLLERTTLNHAYNNVLLVQDENVYIGSLKGLIKLNMSDYQSRQADSPILMHHINHDDFDKSLLTIELFFEDLMDRQNHNLFFKFAHQKRYALLKGSYLTLYEQPASDTVLFKAMDGAGNVVSSKKIDLKSYWAGSRPLTQVFSVGVGPDMLITLGITVLFLLVLCYVYFSKRLLKDLPRVGGNHSEASHIDAAYQRFISRQKRLQQHPDSYGQSGRNIICCMAVLRCNKDLKYVKSLAHLSGVSADVIREDVKDIFDLKGTKEFIRYCHRYFSETDF